MSMRPYRIVEETDTHVTYEYRTGYTWALYAAALVFAMGVALPNQTLSIAGGILVALYFAAKVGLGMAVDEKIRRAMASNAIQISGSKASLRNPLRIRVPK